MILQRPSTGCLAAHVGLLFRQQQLDIGDARQVEIAGNRVLEAARRGREVDRLLRIETADQAVQDAGRVVGDAAGADATARS